MNAMNPTIPRSPMKGFAPYCFAPYCLAALTLGLLTGCASSLSGVGSTESFACKAPIGAQCTSISGVYANAAAFGHSATHESLWLSQGLLATNIPEGSSGKSPSQSVVGALTLPVPATLPGAASSADPAALRSPPRVMRLWIAPWEDADGDLHDASFVHVVVDTGRWLIERVRPAPRSRLDMAKPPLTLSAPPAPSPDAKPSSDLTPTEP
jgi:conjugal transfer pilus assembly protein TraV